MTLLITTNEPPSRTQSLLSPDESLVVSGNGAPRVPRLLLLTFSGLPTASYGWGGGGGLGGLGTFSWTALLPHPCCQFCFQHICLNHGGLREHALSPLCSFGHGDRSSGRNDFCYQDVDTPPPTPSHAQYSRNPQIKKYYKTQHNISIIPNIGHALSGYM